MKNEIVDINEVIIRFLDGTATDEEKTSLLSWLEQSEDNQNDFSELRDLWVLGNTKAADHIKIEVALDQFKKQIQVTDTELQKKKFFFRKQLNIYFRVAAIFLMLLSVGGTFYYWGSHSVTEQLVIMNKLLTADGSKGRFILPDSTIVWLNSNSVLEYPETFTASAREVRLSGEAYFEVRRNEEHPFCVHAGEMDVEVLGTHFIVGNYHRKSKVETVLVEGSVKVTGCKMNHSVVLIPGQLISYDKKNEHIDVQIVNTADYISWIQNELVFDNDKLADIIINLEKWYGINIVCAPEFAKSVSMSFLVRSGENLNEILKAMTLVAPIKYYWDNEVLHIIPSK